MRGTFEVIINLILIGSVHAFCNSINSRCHLTCTKGHAIITGDKIPFNKESLKIVNKSVALNALPIDSSSSVAFMIALGAVYLTVTRDYEDGLVVDENIDSESSSDLESSVVDVPEDDIEEVAEEQVVSKKAAGGGTISLSLGNIMSLKKEVASTKENEEQRKARLITDESTESDDDSKQEVNEEVFEESEENDNTNTITEKKSSFLRKLTKKVIRPWKKWSTL